MWIVRGSLCVLVIGVLRVRVSECFWGNTRSLYLLRSRSLESWPTYHSFLFVSIGDESGRNLLLFNVYCSASIMSIHVVY
jgi:hypothetical protein